MLIAFAGTIIIGLSDVCFSTGVLKCPPLAEFTSGQAFLGDILALLGAWMGAGYLLIGRNLRAKLSLISYISVVYGMAAVILILLVVGARQPFTGYSPNTYLLFLILALVPQLFGHTTVNWALAYLSAAYVSIILLCEPIGSIILAYLFLNETPTPIKLFGAILIFGGVITASNNRPDANLAQT
jgi:drug/metabolite transporter (DMT)-like permease